MFVRAWRERRAHARPRADDPHATLWMAAGVLRRWRREGRPDADRHERDLLRRLEADRDPLPIARRVLRAECGGEEDVATWLYAQRFYTW